MRAAKFYPSWPGMNGQYFPEALRKAEYWSWQAFMEFDTSIFANAFVQFFHRNTAYLITVLTLVFIIKFWKKLKLELRPFDKGTLTALKLLPMVLCTQVLLGIFTIMNAIPTTPVALGVVHQGVALLLLSNLLYINFKLSK
jgi:cytochrome c oxidase assembly protein subunit 15